MRAFSNFISLFLITECLLLMTTAQYSGKYKYIFICLLTAAVAQWVRALAPQAEGSVFEFQPRQT